MSPSPPDEAAASSAPPCVVVTDQERWFTKEVHAHDGQLKSWLRGQFPAIRDVDDLAQESYLRIWKARAREPIESAKAFLFRIARHLALDLVRRQRSSPIDFSEDLSALNVLGNELDAAHALIAQEHLECLGDAIIALPAHYRDVVLLHKIQGLPQKEVAARLGLSPKSVEKYLQRGLTKMSAHLHTHGIHTHGIHGHAR